MPISQGDGIREDSYTSLHEYYRDHGFKDHWLEGQSYLMISLS